MTIFRPAHENDLRPMYEVFYQNEVLDRRYIRLDHRRPFL
jgi:hypothetical protein